MVIISIEKNIIKSTQASEELLSVVGELNEQKISMAQRDESETSNTASQNFKHSESIHLIIYRRRVSGTTACTPQKKGNKKKGKKNVKKGSAKKSNNPWSLANNRLLQTAHV